MLFEYSGICQHCAEEITVLIHNGKVLGDCRACNEPPFNIRKIPGLIYIVSNPNQAGVKIGLTTKSIEQRIKSLNSTGVPGTFEIIALFPTDNPKVDEKRVHKKLERHNISKEHFSIEPVEAVLKAYRALNRKKPIFFNEDIKETFFLQLDDARIKMKLKLKGKSKW